MEELSRADAERSPEGDFRPRRFNVAEVPQTDEEHLSDLPIFFLGVPPSKVLFACPSKL